jgi:hypothetical protein
VSKLESGLAAGGAWVGNKLTVQLQERSMNAE